MLQRSRLTSVVRSLSGVDVRSVDAWWTGAEKDEPDGSGPPANRRLTALTGALVLPLAAAVLLTGLFFGTFWRVHYFVGYLLLPVVLLKIGSTSYRMVRYYLRSGLYRAVRPPYPLGRITSPLLVVSVAMLFVSGIVMWLTRSSSDPWGWLHTDAAVVFSGIVLLHLGMYLPEALGAARDDVRQHVLTASSRRTSRYAVIGAAVFTGLLIAVLTIGPSRLPARSHHNRREVGFELPFPVLPSGRQITSSGPSRALARRLRSSGMEMVSFAAISPDPSLLRRRWGVIAGAQPEGSELTRICCWTQR